MFLILFLDIVNVFLSAYVVSVMWSWFMVPLGLPIITIAHAFGIRLLVRFLTIELKGKGLVYKDDGDKTDSALKRSSLVVFTNLFFFLMAFVAFKFMY